MLLKHYSLGGNHSPDRFQQNLNRCQIFRFISKFQLQFLQEIVINFSVKVPLEKNTLVKKVSSSSFFQTHSVSKNHSPKTSEKSFQSIFLLISFSTGMLTIEEVGAIDNSFALKFASNT